MFFVSSGALGQTERASEDVWTLKECFRPMPRPNVSNYAWSTRYAVLFRQVEITLSKPYIRILTIFQCLSSEVRESPLVTVMVSTASDIGYLRMLCCPHEQEEYLLST